MNSKLSKLLLSPVVLVYGSQSDEELMLKVQQGSIAAYDVLYRRYEKSVWNFMRIKIHDEQARLDLAQDVFLRLFQSASLFNTEKKFKPWFWTMIRNIIKDYFKGKDALSSSMTKDEINHDESSIESFDQDPTFEKLLLKRKADAIEKCINHLTIGQKEAFLLQVFSGLSMQEISNELNLKIGAIKSTLLRAKESLSNCLGGF
jgi:RNA polymerase sigma-70 factor (ECF subfamily)